MKSNNNNKASLGDVLRTSAIVWLGETNLTNTDILVVDFNNTKHIVLIEINSLNKSYTLKAPSDTLSLQIELTNILNELYPYFKEDNYSNTSEKIAMLPMGLSVVRDYNNLLLTKGIKPLKEVTIKTYLDSVGINITLYEYSKIKVDNSHTIKVDTITKGYKNYAKEALQYAIDVSKYKGMKPTYPSLVELVLQGAYFILAGPAGTGKTTEFKIVGANEGIPVYLVSFTANSQEDDFLSTFLPNTSDDGKSFVLKRSVFTYAFEYGGIVILDEINYAHPNVLSAFHAALDDTATITLDDGTVLHRHKDFRCVATMNPNYSGTNKLNAAFLDRFDHFEWPKLSKQDVVDRLKVNTGYKNDRVLSVIGDIYEKLSDLYLAKNFETEVTYRRVESFLTKLLLNPEMDRSFIFDIAFLNITALTDLDDIPTELAELREIREHYLKDLDSVLNVKEEEYVEGTFITETGINLNDLNTDLDEDKIEIV